MRCVSIRSSLCSAYVYTNTQTYMQANSCQKDQRFPRHCTMMFTTYHIDDIIFSCTYIRFEVLFLTTDKLRDLIITKFSNAYVNREVFWLQILVHVHVVNREAFWLQIHVHVHVVSIWYFVPVG